MRIIIIFSSVTLRGRKLHIVRRYIAVRTRIVREIESKPLLIYTVDFTRFYVLIYYLQKRLLHFVLFVFYFVVCFENGTVYVSVTFYCVVFIYSVISDCTARGIIVIIVHHRRRSDLNTIHQSPG